MIAKYRAMSAGAGSLQQLQTSELKLLSKDSKLNVCHNAGVKQRASFKAHSS